MNAKTAKKLRRLAERATPGQPRSDYERNFVTRTRRVQPTSTRGVYRDLKRTLAEL